MLKQISMLLLCVGVFGTVCFGAHTGMGGTYAAGQGTVTIGAFDWSGVVGGDVITQSMADIGTVGAQYDGRTIPAEVFGQVTAQVEYKVAVDGTNMYIQIAETAADDDHVDATLFPGTYIYATDAVALFFSDRTDPLTAGDLIIGFNANSATPEAIARGVDGADVPLTAASTVIGGLRVSEASIPLALLEAPGGVLRADGLLIDPWDAPPDYNWQAQSFQGGGLWAIGDDATNYTYITDVPEPATFALLGLGGLLLRRRR